MLGRYRTPWLNSFGQLVEDDEAERTVAAVRFGEDERDDTVKMLRRRHAGTRGSFVCMERKQRRGKERLRQRRGGSRAS
jgi:hypothetical protein